MSNKYKINYNFSKTIGCHDEIKTLYKVQALKDFTTSTGIDVKKDDFGGYIDDEANLSQEDICWIADDACVYGNARVIDKAYIGDSAKIGGDVFISNSAVVIGHAKVLNNASVFESAIVMGDATVTGSAHVYGNAIISNYAFVGGSSVVCDYAQIIDHAHVAGASHICDNTMIGGKVNVFNIWLLGDTKLFSDGNEAEEAQQKIKTTPKKEKRTMAGEWNATWGKYTCEADANTDVIADTVKLLYTSEFRFIRED